MNRPAAKGWCPGTLNPMMSGDGLLVRVRPKLGRLTGEQVAVLCAAADAYGSGLIDLTSRGNLQVRGVTERTYTRLLGELQAADLVDENVAIEARNNVLVSPLWQVGDDSAHIAEELIARLKELPDLPSKFGFAVDASGRTMLASASADIRVEHGRSGQLIVRLDGTPVGEQVSRDRAVDRVVSLCHWFVETGGGGSKRMFRHAPKPPIASDATMEMPVPAAPAMVPGPTELGLAYGVPFGSMSARNLATLFRRSGADALRTTPWRSFVLECGQAVDCDAFIVDPAHPLLDVVACPGAPHCASATVNTRQLARDIADLVAGPLHVSGCTKGCAHPSAAPIALVGRSGKFDMVRNGCAWEPPDETGLNPAEVRERLGGI